MNVRTASIKTKSFPFDKLREQKKSLSKANKGSLPELVEGKLYIKNSKSFPFDKLREQKKSLSKTNKGPLLELVEGKLYIKNSK